MRGYQFVFALFRLDLVNEQLWQEEAIVPLRPKLFAVLRHLVEHAGRLVTQEELRKAVWPTTVISESVLRGAIRELRAVLGDDADAARFIETVPHRGYRFVAPVTVTPPVHAAVPGRQCASQGVHRPQHLTLIGRDAELARLQEWLDRAVRGARQIVFVTGEPGIGKTTAVDTFLAQAAVSGDLWTARGQCVEHYGPSEAYLPVLEALGQLCRGPGGAQVIPLLSRYAPTWLAQMPGLMGEAELEAVHRRAQGATRERMQRELAEALEVLTAATPVVLVLEDLHWSDYSTLDLLAVVAQRRGAARLLLLGTYRPAEVIVSGHPLKALSQELRVHGQCEELPLRVFTENEVAQYVAARFPRQQLPPALGRAMHQRTEGNPLFLVTVVDYWVSQGVLVDTAGQWQLVARVEDLAAGVPESVRQMVEKQLGRLTPEERRLLEAASVAGVEFSTAAVAAGLEEQGERVEEWCEGLAKREQFLRARGTEILVDGTLTGRYGFLHALYQQVLYERLAAVRRIHLHRRIGEWEERAYGERGGEHAAELAVHFERGQDYQQAVRYLTQAADNARRRHAYQEEITLLTRALGILKLLPDTPERAQQELALQLSLGAPLLMTRGYAAPEVEQTYARAQALCQQIGESPQLLPALAGLCRFYLMRAELQTARELGEQVLRLAQRMGDKVEVLIAHSLLGVLLLTLGHLLASREHLERGIALYNPNQHRIIAARFGDDPGVSCRSFIALAFWFLGYPEQALNRSLEALGLAQELALPYSVAFALSFTTWVYVRRREGGEAQARINALLSLATEQGFQLWTAEGTILQGWALAEQGHIEEGLAQMQQGLAAYRTMGAEMGRPSHLALLAEAYGKAGRTDEGLNVLAEALAAVGKTGERTYEAELCRLKGELTLQRQLKVESQKAKIPNPQHSTLDTLAAAEAEACFLKAIEVSRTQQAKSFELRATLSLARLWRQQGKKTRARRMLADIYGWFTEGFDTVDLTEARALLAALGPAGGKRR